MFVIPGKAKGRDPESREVQEHFFQEVVTFPLLELDLASAGFVVQSLPMSDKHQQLSLSEDPAAAWASVFRALGLPLYRVRKEDRMALIQAPPEDFARILVPEVREILLQHGKSLGYLFVMLDLNYPDDEE